MARRNDHSRDEIKSMAIAAGRDLIEAHGFAAFSTRKVASEIGYTVGTLYNVFKNYDDLVLHINAATLDDFARYLDQGQNPTKAGLDAILELGRLYIDFARNHGERWAVLFEHRLSGDELLPDWYQAKLADLFGRIEAVLLPLLREDRRAAAEAAKALWAGVHGVFSLGFTGKLDVIEKTSMDDLAKNIIKTYIRGLGCEEA